MIFESLNKILILILLNLLFLVRNVETELNKVPRAFPIYGFLLPFFSATNYRQNIVKFVEPIISLWNS